MPLPVTAELTISVSTSTLVLPLTGVARTRTPALVFCKNTAPSPSAAPTLTTVGAPPTCQGVNHPGSPAPWPLSGALLMLYGELGVGLLLIPDASLKPALAMICPRAVPASARMVVNTQPARDRAVMSGSESGRQASPGETASP